MAAKRKGNPDPSPRPDDISSQGSGSPTRPIPPNMENLHAAISGDMAAVQSGVDAATDAQITEIDRQLQEARSSVDLAIREGLGKLSIDTDAVSAPVHKAVDKLYDDVLRSNAAGLYEVDFNGIHVPYNPQSMREILDDPTGELVVQSVMGVSPEGNVNAPPVNVASGANVGTAPNPVRVLPPIVGPPSTASDTFTALPPSPPPSGTGTVSSGDSGTTPATGRAIPTGITSPPVVIGGGGGIVLAPPTVPPPPLPGTVPVPPPPPEPVPVVPPVVPPPCECPPKDCRPLTDAVICWPTPAGTVPPPPTTGGEGEGTSPPPPAPPEGEGEEPPPTEVEPAALAEPLAVKAPALIWPLPYHDPEICALIPQYADGFAQLGYWLKGERDNLNTIGDDLADRRRQFDFIAAGEGVINSILGAVFSFKASTKEVRDAVLDYMTVRFINRFTETIKFNYSELLDSHSEIFRVDSPTLVGCYFFRTMIDIAQSSITTPNDELFGVSATGPLFLKLRQIVDYCIQWVAPVVAPSVTDIATLWLQSVITDEHASCLVRLHGLQWPVTRAAWIQARERPNTTGVTSLYLRGLIDVGEWRQRMADLGVKSDVDSKAFLDLAQFIPPYSDIVSWMVRDSFDDNVAAQYQFDKDFDKKFTGPAYDYARAQGIDPSVFKLIWRSHWKIPSNTQLYEILARYRRDRPEYQQYEVARDAWVLNGSIGDPPKEPPVVDPVDIQNALEVNDNAPSWVPFLMGISTHPINPSDASRAYQAGAFTEDQLYHALRDNLYSAETAALRVSIERSMLARRTANVTGQGTPRSIAKWYREGIVSRQEADRLLTPLLPDFSQRTNLLDMSDAEVKAETMRAWRKRARRAYFTGVWNAEETKDNLLLAGFAAGRVAAIIEQWTADVRGRYREPTARQIIQWMQINVITPQDAYQRLTNLGWLELDANRIVFQGIVAYQEKVTGLVDKQNAKIRTRIRDIRAAKKERDQELKDLQKQIQNEMKALADEQKRVQDEMKKRGLA